MPGLPQAYTWLEASRSRESLQNCSSPRRATACKFTAAAHSNGRGKMLADALKAYDKKVAAGEAKPPPQPTAPTHEPPSLAGLHVSAPSGQISQSLPSGGNHFSMLPPKPRPRPSMPNISHLPILELPEPSPHSCSLLDEHPMQHSSMIGQPETGADPMADDVGGTCVERPLPPSLPPSPRIFAPRVAPFVPFVWERLEQRPFWLCMPRASHTPLLTCVARPAGRCWSRRPRRRGGAAATCTRRRRLRRCCGDRRRCIGTFAPFWSTGLPLADPSRTPRKS
jgi:hypothetical protein